MRWGRQNSRVYNKIVRCLSLLALLIAYEKTEEYFRSFTIFQYVVLVIDPLDEPLLAGSVTM